LEHKSVKVIYDPRKTTEEKLNKAIEDLDYTFKKVEDKTT
jgi:copper chaperone CopZ